MVEALGDVPKQEEVLACVGRLNNRKTTGLSGLAAEYLKAMCDSKVCLAALVGVVQGGDSCCAVWSGLHQQ